jgi:hypothetical protein
VGDQPVARPLPTHRTTQTHNKSIQTFMPRVGFEPSTPVFERAKTVHVLHLAATVIGHRDFYSCLISVEMVSGSNPCQDTVLTMDLRGFL